MFDIILNDFLNQFVKFATEKSAAKTAEVVVDGLFNSFQNSASNADNRSKGRVDKIWVDYDVQQDNQRGILIHIKFQVNNLTGIKCRASAYFYFKDGNTLKDLNSSYYATDGQVCVGKDFTPPYEESLYEDFTMFMPYEELHLPEGKNDLKFGINLYDQITKTKITSSNDHHFHYTYFDNQPRGTFKKIWVDFDAVEAEVPGMRIHLNFQLDNLRGVKCQFTAFFYSSDETPLKGSNNNYCSSNGQLCTSINLTPEYKNSIYKDFALFLPYSELHSTGEHCLIFRVTLFNLSKQTVVMQSNDYHFYVDEEVTFGEEEVIDTMSMIQVIFARQLDINTSEVDLEADFVELFGTSLLESKNILSLIEKNFNINFDCNDPEETSVLSELNTPGHLSFAIIFKRKCKQPSQNSASTSAQSEMIIIACPKCSQKLRTPSNRGKLKLICPKCKYSWQWLPTL